jgi:hypothetical protein
MRRFLIRRQPREMTPGCPRLLPMRFLSEAMWERHAVLTLQSNLANLI